ncbi:dnaJ homolog subfamily C member 12-like [Patella vulgata]|uniref:dnaJ homolog subfamily C member 12-like n=1 Tax=Patella vulgata TaxID=6465 RepID=UPI0024A875A1|nr:dnaJ homolog subfamily C member 12-like [Patella vulgata]
MDDILKYEKDDSENFYSVLGCDELSSEEQIVAEYKARVNSCHPDKNPDDPTAAERFIRIQKAKEVLTDPSRRKKYDRWRRSGLSISYSQWCNMAPAQMSMHWASSKAQPMISDTTTSNIVASKIQDDAPKTRSIPTHFTNERENNMGEKQTNSKTEENCKRSSINLHCFKDTPADLIRKFRNYEI